MIVLLGVIVVLVICILVSCIKIVPQAQAYVIERLGAYQGTWSVGFHLKAPFIDKVARRVNLKEQVADFPPQPVITKDNVCLLYTSWTARCAEEGTSQRAVDSVSGRGSLP